MALAMSVWIHCCLHLKRQRLLRLCLDSYTLIQLTAYSTYIKDLAGRLVIDELMIYLLILLFAAWNGYVIRWKHLNTKRDSDMWHRIGVVNKIGLLLLVLAMFLPDWYGYVINPFALLTGWYGISLTILVAFLCSYFFYNMIINRIRGLPWYYQKWLPNDIYAVFFYISLFLIVAWGSLGHLIL